MKRLIYQTQCKHLNLNIQLDDIIQRTMTRLYWNNIYLISAEAQVDDMVQLRWMAQSMLQQCNRVVVLATQLEDLNLIVAKSANVSHLYVDEIMESITSVYGGKYAGTSVFAEATFYQAQMMPDIIDHAVESIVVAMPYK